MIFDQLEANMLADLGRPTSNSVQNEIKSLGIKFPKARTGLAKVFNQFVEISRQAREGEIMRPQANKQIRELLIPQASDYVHWAVNGDPDETPGYESPKDDALNPDADMQEGSELLKKFDPAKADLKSALVSNNHVLSYAPVIPLCKPYLLSEKLSEKGFKFAKLSHYVVLERQLVVGIDNDWMKGKVAKFSQVEGDFKDLVKLGLLTKKATVSSGEFNAAAMALRKAAITVLVQMKSSKAAQELLEKLKPLKPEKSIDDANAVCVNAREVCALLKAQLDTYAGPVDEKMLIASFVKAAAKSLKKNLEVFGSTVNYMGATWVWLMTPKEVNMLQGCALGGHFSLVRWGFAFDNEGTK